MPCSVQERQFSDVDTPRIVSRRGWCKKKARNLNPQHCDKLLNTWPPSKNDLNLGGQRKKTELKKWHQERRTRIHKKNVCGKFKKAYLCSRTNELNTAKGACNRSQNSVNMLSATRVRVSRLLKWIKF